MNHQEGKRKQHTFMGRQKCSHRLNMLTGKVMVCFIMALLFSCEEPIEWEPKTVAKPMLVAEGMITNQPGMNYVRLSLPVTDPNTLPVYLKGADVVVRQGADSVIFLEDNQEPGLYRPAPDVRAVVNRAYWLVIRYAEFQFYAAAYMVPGTALREMSYRPDNQKAGYYIINQAESATPAMIRYDVKWNQNGSLPPEHDVFYQYVLSSVNVNEFFKPEAEKMSFPADAMIIRTKYSLSPDHEDFIRSMLSETEWKGGWFDVLPGNLHSNLSRGGVGYFAACSVIRDTVYFE